MLAVSLHLKSFDLSIFSDLKWCLHVFERPSMQRNSFVLRKKTERQGWDQVKGGGRERDGGGRWCCWLHHHENGDNKSIWHEKFKPIILDLMEIQARVRLTTPLFNNSASQDSPRRQSTFQSETRGASVPRFNSRSTSSARVHLCLWTLLFTLIIPIFKIAALLVSPANPQSVESWSAAINMSAYEYGEGGSF